MIDWAQLIVTFLGILLGSGLIQFFITRKDNKDKEITQIQKELNQEINRKEKKYEQHYSEQKEEIEDLKDVIEKLSRSDFEQSKYMKYVGDEIMGLAHDKLVRLTDKYQDRGAITLKELATLKAIYQPYHEGLGGNGDGQAGYEYCIKLPVVSEEQAKKLDAENRDISTAC